MSSSSEHGDEQSEVTRLNLTFLYALHETFILIGAGPQIKVVKNSTHVSTVFEVLNCSAQLFEIGKNNTPFALFQV